MEAKIYKIELQVSELIVEDFLQYGAIRYLTGMGQNVFCVNPSECLDAEKALQIVSTIKQVEDILKQIRSQQQKENLETTSDLCKEVLDDAG